MLSDVPLTRDLVMVGGGHAHALVLRAWGMKPLPGARLTVINPGPTAPYTGMLPGYVAGHYGRDDLEIDLVRLCRHAGAALILGEVDAIDREARSVHVAGRGDVGYDVASIDIGITAAMDLPGFAAHGIGAKPLAAYAARWSAFLDQVAAGEVAPEVAVIGGGVAGCELAMAMAHAMAMTGVVPQVTVIEAGPGISGMGDGARRRVDAAMAGLGVTVRCGVTVAEVAPGAVRLERGGEVPAQLCVGAAGAFPHGWLAQTDLPLVAGFIDVRPDLRVRGDDALFAVGDCAHMSHAPRPKAGVFAVRAAPVLKHNLRVALAGGAMRHFKPQKHYLKLVSLGGKRALAEKFGVAVEGAALWQWKDRIDRAFMDRLSDLPVMQVPQPKGQVAKGYDVEAKPMCAGCGAKVGSGVLRDALGGLGPATGDVLTTAGDDAAVLRQTGGGFQVISTDHLRGFVADPVVMTRIAAVHALGDVWAMGAQPQVALASVVLPQMSPALQARQMAEITQAATEVLGDAGAQLVGGHTTMGAEMTIGFTVTGTRDTAPITVAGAQAGDVLVLTRPIGSGVILAGEMQGKAAGRDVTGLLAQMAAPQGETAGALAKARAMTDVTGFGLAGHVAAIARASAMEAVLWQDQIPVYAGARALSAAGVASSLMRANRADAPVAGVEDPLLHDPQTAGGLLAAMSAQDAAAALAEIGPAARIIGTLRAGMPGQITLEASR
ncbi:selenide, water dikinase SelD [uncultured Sulfitobacter sp.]|uniref:selenide, water dikinase SelD n=1 Tax=uncultured Sulfitobacter sp. TaxID=191468 RepID=UPI00345D1970